MAGEIRQKIDLDKLSRWIEKNVPDIKTPLGVKQFGYGQSNPTYLLTASDGNQYVMRKKPPGKLVSPTAHQVDREYRIIHSLQDTPVPVPKAMCLCEDAGIIGTSFYIMSFLDGRIFEDPALPDASPEDRRKLWHSAVTTLAKFHSVSPKSVGMEDFGRRNGFYDRQLKTFNRISEDQANIKDVETQEPVGKLPHYDEMVEFFAKKETQPVDRSTFVHGDCKIDNVVFHKTEPRVIGVLDWEMATIGHPLSDLVNLIAPFTTAKSSYAEEAGRRNVAFLEGSTREMPTKEECLRWYEETVDIKDGAESQQGLSDEQAAQSVSYSHPVETGRKEKGLSGEEAAQSVGYSHPVETGQRESLSGEEAAQAVGYNHPVDTGDAKSHSDSNAFKVDKKELTWAEAFGIYRGAIIMQGIKARYAVRQASSLKAMEYGRTMGPQAEMAWEFVKDLKRQFEQEGGWKARL